MEPVGDHIPGQGRVVLDQEGDPALLGRRPDDGGQGALLVGRQAGAGEPQAGDVASRQRRREVGQEEPGLEDEPGRGGQVEPAGRRVDLAQRRAC
jgi:hypothetical protein